MRAKDVLGRRGEELAAGYLEAQGMRIVDRNWRCAEGEIDIVALDGDALVIAEVKTRKSLPTGIPSRPWGWTNWPGCTGWRRHGAATMNSACRCAASM